MSMFKRFGVLKGGKYTVNLGKTEDNPGRTKQSHKKECDINEIVRRARATGYRVAGNVKQPLYADVSEIPSFSEAMMFIKETNEKFEHLDPKIRRRFGNDPEKMLAYLEDPNLDRKEAEELGLLKKTEITPPVVEEKK